MRLFDILISGVALFFLLPFLLPLALLLRLTGEGAVFYRQKRVGKDRQIFELLKFATMLKDSPNIGAGTLTMKDDPRILPLGKFLRKTKINELPQLYNICKGDMAIVGPRPLVPEGERVYRIEAAKIIRSVRPGLTGIGSILLRDEEGLYAHRSDAKKFYTEVIQPYKEGVELYYVHNRSIAMDIQIIILTAVVIIFPHVNVERFFKGMPPKCKSLNLHETLE